MAKLITLKFEGKCADKSCGAVLPVGSKAKWYGRGRVYGIGCHGSKPSKKRYGGYRNSGINVYYSPSTGNEWSQNARGRCEDAPCCGCCTY